MLPCSGDRDAKKRLMLLLKARYDDHIHEAWTVRTGRRAGGQTETQVDR